MNNKLISRICIGFIVFLTSLLVLYNIVLRFPYFFHVSALSKILPDTLFENNFCGVYPDFNFVALILLFIFFLFFDYTNFKQDFFKNKNIIVASVIVFFISLLFIIFFKTELFIQNWSYILLFFILFLFCVFSFYVLIKFLSDLFIENIRFHLLYPFLFFILIVGDFFFDYASIFISFLSLFVLFLFHVFKRKSLSSFYIENKFFLFIISIFFIFSFFLEVFFKFWHNYYLLFFDFLYSIDEGFIGIFVGILSIIILMLFLYRPSFFSLTFIVYSLTFIPVFLSKSLLGISFKESLYSPFQIIMMLLLFSFLIFYFLFTNTSNLNLVLNKRNIFIIFSIVVLFLLVPQYDNVASHIISEDDTNVSYIVYCDDFSEEYSLRQEQIKEQIKLRDNNLSEKAFSTFNSSYCHDINNTEKRVDCFLALEHNATYCDQLNGSELAFCLITAKLNNFYYRGDDYCHKIKQNPYGKICNSIYKLNYTEYINMCNSFDNRTIFKYCNETSYFIKQLAEN